MSTPLISKFRVDFPALTQKVRGKPLVYLDSAATALKPWPVIERIGHFYSYESANVHRGAHFLSDQATGFFEASRQKIAEFIGAIEATEIVFTRGTTESINLVAQTWGKSKLKSGDMILLTEMEHHANLVPWQMLAEEKSLKLEFVRVLDNGELDQDDFRQKLKLSPKIVAFNHCSNTLGTINPVKDMVAAAKSVGAVTLVDGAQWVANGPVSVNDLDVDFYVFSGHKLFGPTGVGILYGKSEILKALPPYQGGGAMISTVTLQKTTFNDVPYRFEAGTPHIEGVIGMKSAIEYMEKVGYDFIHQHESALLSEATQKIKDLGFAKILGTAAQKVPIVSMIFEGMHPSDVGQILDQEGVAVRAGHHCTQPLMQKFKIPGTVRASFSVFNTSADIDRLIQGLIKAKELLS